MSDHLQLHISSIENQDSNELLDSILSKLKTHPFTAATIELANRYDQTLARFEFQGTDTSDAQAGFFLLKLFPALTPLTQPTNFDTLINPADHNHLAKLRGFLATHTVGIPELVQRLASALAHQYQRLQVESSPLSSTYFVPEFGLMLTDIGAKLSDDTKLDATDPEVFYAIVGPVALCSNPYFLGLTDIQPAQPTWFAYSYQHCNLEHYPQLIDDLSPFIQNVAQYYRVLRGMMFIRDRQVLPQLKKMSISTIADMTLAPPTTIVTGIKPEKYFLTASLRKKNGLDLKKLFNL